MKTVAELSVKIFADGAELSGMVALYRLPYIRGFTTNPTLMHKAGIQDYRAFAREVLAEIPDRPISFEVFSDEFPDMERQAREIATWGDHVYVKIPVTNTRREPAYELIHRLSHAGVKVNVTAGRMQLVAKEQMATVRSLPLFAGKVFDSRTEDFKDIREATTEQLPVYLNSPGSQNDLLYREMTKEFRSKFPLT